jgi:hypothetical protein
MAMTSTEVKAPQLKEIGIYNLVVEIPFSLPKFEKTGDKEGDRARYQEALQRNSDDAGKLLLSRALELGACPKGDIPVLKAGDRKNLATEKEITEQVTRRRDPETYRGLWGKPLAEVKEEIATLGRPDPCRFDERRFVRAEMEADARLYRDPRFREGIIATLEGKVANFKED